MPSAALGKRIRYLPDLPWHEVIGVVQDVRENGVVPSGTAHRVLADDVCVVEREARSAECHPRRELHRPQRPAPHDRSSEPDPAGRLVGEPRTARVTAHDARGLRPVTRAHVLTLVMLAIAASMALLWASSASTA